MKKSYLFSMLLFLALGFSTKTTYAAAQADSISVTLWCGINDSLYDASAGGVWVTGDFTGLIKHPGTDFWWHMPLDSIGRIGKVAWYKIIYHYKPGSMADSAVTMGVKQPELLHDSAFWLFALSSAWALGETVGAPCNKAWGVNRSMTFGTKDTTLAFLWGKCEVMAAPVFTSVAQLSTPQLSIFPNPASDLVNLKNTIGMNSLKIYDMTGRLVDQIRLNGKSEISVSLKGLSSQMYMLQIQNMNGTLSTTKLFKR
jgi:hypothetical protein